MQKNYGIFPKNLQKLRFQFNSFLIYSCKFKKKFNVNVCVAWLGAKIAHTDKKIAKLLEFTLIPQEGVSIGLSIAAAAVFGAGSVLGSQIRVVILATVLIYELIGPVVTKMVLKKAGKISITA